MNRYIKQTGTKNINNYFKENFNTILMSVLDENPKEENSTVVYGISLRKISSGGLSVSRNDAL